MACFLRSGQGTKVRLTRTKWELQPIPLGNPGRLNTQREPFRASRGPDCERRCTLPAAIYGPNCAAKSKTTPSRLRYLITEPGMGYRFQPDDD
jgi:two-component system KDP operon response regulator KdpE